MSEQSVTVILIVRNGEKYVRHCLGAVIKQTYQPFEIIVFDNNSSDSTVEIIEKEFSNVKVHRNQENLFVGPAFNKAFRLGLCQGDYILLLCVDVILDENFILEAVKTMQDDSTIGALQAKILKFDPAADFGNKFQIPLGKLDKTNIIDTTGFEIFKSRRVINRGHGVEDRGQYNRDGEVFSYEGAAGFFRKKALADVQINGSTGGEIFDEDFEWMADDLDLGWRLRLFGWKNYYNHRMICYHDRKTTKRLSSTALDFIKQRKEIPPLKKKLDFRNLHLTLLKNDFFLHFLKDFWYIFWREFRLYFYILFFERSTLPAFCEILKLSSRIFKKRKEIMVKEKVSPQDIEKWFN